MMKPVTIKPVLNGFVVEVGCQTVVFQSVDKLIDSLRKYQADPDTVEQMFMKNAVNRENDRFVMGNIDFSPIIHRRFNKIEVGKKEEETKEDS